MILLSKTSDVIHHFLLLD